MGPTWRRCMPGSSRTKTGLVLLQMGGPQNPDQLAPFLRALFQDPEMIRLPTWMKPLQRMLGGLYGSLRARDVLDEYEAIGWSPLVPTIQTIADRLERRLDGSIHGIEPAMRYTPPRATTAIQNLTEAGIDHLIALPLYPFYSLATTGSNLKDIRQARDQINPSLTIEPIHHWGTHPTHIDLVQTRLEDTLEHAGQGDHRAVLLSAHGIPQAYVDNDNDPYPRLVKAAADKLAQRFPHERIELAYQSDLGPVRWVSPSTPEAIETLAQGGVDELVLVPFGFLTDHIEVAYEIDDEYREHAHDHGIEHVHRAPTLGTDEDLIDLLTQLTRHRLEAPA